MTKCAFFGCSNKSDPRWGEYCDGHGATSDIQFVARDRDEARAQLASAQLEVVELRRVLSRWPEECECSPDDMEEYMHDKTRVALGSPTVGAPLIEAIERATYVLNGFLELGHSFHIEEIKKAIAALEPWIQVKK